MKLKSESYVYIALMIIMLLTIIQTLMMTSFVTESLPLIVSSIGFVLASAGLWRGVVAQKKGQVVKRRTEGEEERRTGSWKGYLAHSGWVVGYVAGIYFLGFLVATFIFTLTYMKHLGSRWTTTIVSAILAPVFIWAAFELGLKVTMWRGVVFGWLGY